jgi:hypothetical protein
MEKPVCSLLARYIVNKKIGSATVEQIFFVEG